MSDRKKTQSFPSGHVCSSVTVWGWLAAISVLRGTTLWQNSKDFSNAIIIVDDQNEDDPAMTTCMLRESLPEGETNSPTVGESEIDARRFR